MADLRANPYAGDKNGIKIYGDRIDGANGLDSDFTLTFAADRQSVVVSDNRTTSATGVEYATLFIEDKKGTMVSGAFNVAAMGTDITINTSTLNHQLGNWRITVNFKNALGHKVTYTFDSPSLMPTGAAITFETTSLKAE